MTPTIREKVLHCSRLFNSASAKSEELKDASQHFVNWYSNIAAHRAGPASLDERLRDAPDVRVAILRFLDILISMFDDYKYRNASDGMSYSSKEKKPLDILVNQAASSKPITLMYKVIYCLKRITIAIRAPASVDRYKKAQNVDIDYHRSTDRSHIMELFPAAGPILQERLLEAVLSRRRFLQYTQDHRKKLGHEASFQNSQDVGEGIDAEEKSEFADTVATPISPEIPLGNILPMGLLHNDRDETATIFSNSSSLRSDMTARVPSMPLEGQGGKPFECPCCFLMIEVKDRDQWKRHVITDMRPYVCTFADCKVPDMLFSSRHDWYSHEIAFHRRKWFCISTCSLQFDSKESFDRHIKAIHISLLGTADAETHGAYSRQLPEYETTQCPLCSAGIRYPERVKNHIGRHQAQLGLWPLRSMREFEDDEIQQECEEANTEVDDSEEEDEEEVEKEKVKANKIIALEKYLQMRQSGKIKPRREADSEVNDSQEEEEGELRWREEVERSNSKRPVTPPQKSNSEQRKVLEAFLQKRQSREIKPPREILEARESRDLESTSETKTGPVHEPELEPERPPIRKLEPEALRELEENASDFKPPT